MSEENNIPTHWQIKTLGEVCEKVEKVNRKGKDLEEDLLYLDIGGIDNNTNKILTHKSYKWKNAPSRAQQIVFIDDILFSTVRTYMKNIALVENRIFDGQIASSGFCVIRGKHKIISSKFIFYYSISQSFLQPLNELQTGSSYPAVRDKDVFSQPIPIPPITEQQAIVSKIEELLSDLDNGKQQLLLAQQQLKIYRQSLLKWAFEGKLCLNLDSSDLYDEHDLKKKGKNQGNQDNHKNHSSDNLPKGWKWVTLGDVCTNVEYGSATKSKIVGKVPVLRMGNIQNGKFDWNDLVYTDDKEEIEKYLLKKGDVLFNRTNSAEWVGKTAQYKGERPSIFAGYLIRINRIESMIDATYLTYFLNTHFAKSYGNSVRSFGVNQSNINGTKLKTYPIPLCSLAEQQLIVDELESKLTVCDKIEETISQSLLQAESLRQSILKKAFEGKLV